MTRPRRSWRNGFFVCLAAALTTGLASAPTPVEAGRYDGNSRYGPNGPGVYNHPVDVVPSAAVKIPLGWPLSRGGAITCTTCHTAIPNPSSSDGPNLRDPGYAAEVPTVFCGNCHRVDGLGDAGSHWMAGSVAHVQPQKRSGHRAGGSVDSESRQCLSCHDGASATASANPTPDTMIRTYAGDSRRDHPVGVEYRPEKFVDRDVPLKPATTLPPEVQLPDGKVSCVSCHNIYAGTDHMLTVSVRGSKLCLTCHDLD